MATIFASTIFNAAVFETAGTWPAATLDTFHAEFMRWAGRYAEYYEHATGPRPVFTCSKADLRSQLTDLDALLPTTRAVLKTAMTLVPAAYQDRLADFLLTEGNPIWSWY